MLSPALNLNLPGVFKVIMRRFVRWLMMFNLALNSNLPGVFKVVREVVDDVQFGIKRKFTRSF